MRYYEDKSIRGELKKYLRKLDKIIAQESVSAREIIQTRGNISVIPQGFASYWLDLSPSALKYQEAKCKLAYHELSPIERKKYQQQLSDTQRIEDYIIENPIPSDHLMHDILRGSCKDALELNENDMCLRASMFFPGIDYIRTVEKKRQISLMEFDLSLISKENGFDLLDLDKAIRLTDADSILPLSIYLQFKRLSSLLSEMYALDITLPTVKEKTSVAYNALLLRSHMLKGQLNFWMKTYPFLKEKPFHDLDRVFLEHYTRTPSEIIEMFGPDIVCFPYEVPEEMKNSPFDPSRN